MKTKDIYPLITRNPMLALKLLTLPKSALGSAQLYLPEDEAKPFPDFNRFCDKLGIKRKPTLLVVDDYYFKEISDQGQAGWYNTATHLVCVPRVIAEAMKNSKPLARYVVAHEMGHAADNMGRRSFLRGALAIAAGTTLAIGVPSVASTDLDADNGLRWVEYGSAVAAVVAAYTVFEGLERLSQRGEEFRADAHAVEVLGKEEVLKVLAQGAIKEIRQIMPPEKILEMREAYEKGRGDTQLTQAEDDIAFALYVSSRMSRTLTLRDYIHNRQYPHVHERISRINGSGRG